MTASNGAPYGAPRRARRSPYRASSPQYACDRCWREAQTITVLPGLFDPRVARVTCWEHQPEGDLLGGAWGFKLADWFSYGVPDWNDRREMFSMRKQMLAKRNGDEAVRLVERALARVLVERGA